MATLMRGSAVRLPRWLRAGRRAPRDAAPLIGVVILGALLIWQCVNLLLGVDRSARPAGRRGSPQTAVITHRRPSAAIFSRASTPSTAAGRKGRLSATVTSSLGLTLFRINLNEATGGGSRSLRATTVTRTLCRRRRRSRRASSWSASPSTIFSSTAAARAACFSIKAATRRSPIPRRRCPPRRRGRIPGCSDQQHHRERQMSPAALKAGIGFAPLAHRRQQVTGLSVQPQGDGAVFRAADLRPGDVHPFGERPSVGSAADAATLASQLRPVRASRCRSSAARASFPVALFLSKQ